jgi:glyoxylase-like metal-dependent hydrolase (beta-lactamase superfamily II)
VAFVGDVGGARIAGARLTIPPTPPPDIDLEKWHKSIELIRAWKPRRLVMTHFGSSEDVDAQLTELSARLDDWAALARYEEIEAFVASVRDEIAGQVDSDTAAAYEQAAPPEQLYAGLERYWRKRAEAVRSA